MTPQLTSFLRSHSCSTCHLTSFECPGHFGHIELPAPVFHPLYMVQAFQLLRGTCTYCHRFLVGEIQVRRAFPSSSRRPGTDARVSDERSS